MAASRAEAREEWGHGFVDAVASKHTACSAEGAAESCFAYEPRTVSSLPTSLSSQATSSTCAAYLTHTFPVEYQAVASLRAPALHCLAHAPSAPRSSANAALWGGLESGDGAGSLSATHPLPSFSSHLAAKLESEAERKEREHFRLWARSSAASRRAGDTGEPRLAQRRGETRGGVTHTGQDEVGAAKRQGGGDYGAEEAGRLNATQVGWRWRFACAPLHRHDLCVGGSCQRRSWSQPCIGTKREVPLLRVPQPIEDQDVGAQNGAFLGEEVQTSSLRLSAFLKAPRLPLFSSGLYLPRPSFASSSSPPSPVSTSFSSSSTSCPSPSSSSSASSSGRPEPAEAGGGPYILYLEPSPASPLHRILDDRARKVAEIWGPDPAHCYPPHCSLSGFFTCADIDAVKQSLISLFRETLAETASGTEAWTASERGGAGGEETLSGERTREERAPHAASSTEGGESGEAGERTLLVRAGGGSREAGLPEREERGETANAEAGEEPDAGPKAVQAVYPKSFPSTPREEKGASGREGARKPRCSLGCVSVDRCQREDKCLPNERVVRRLRSERTLHLIRSSTCPDRGERAPRATAEGCAVPGVAGDASASPAEPNAREESQAVNAPSPPAAGASSSATTLPDDSSFDPRNVDMAIRHGDGFTGDPSAVGKAAPTTARSLLSSLTPSFSSVASSHDALTSPMSALSALSPADIQDAETGASGFPHHLSRPGTLLRWVADSQSPRRPHRPAGENKGGSQEREEGAERRPEGEEEELHVGKRHANRPDWHERKEQDRTSTGGERRDGGCLRNGKRGVASSHVRRGEADQGEKERLARTEDSVVMSTEDGYVVLCLSSTCLSRTLIRLKEHLRDAAKVHFRMKAGDHVTLASHRSDPKTREAIKHFYQSAFFGSKESLLESTWDIVLFQLEKKAKNYLTDGRHRFSE
ncbi:conserved hypothetical protein, partial [Neospora caninum Liverpool]